MVWKGPRSPKHIAKLLRSHLSPRVLLLDREPCGDSPNLPFLAFLDLLFSFSRNSLFFWASFPSFSGILGVRQEWKIIVFFCVCLACFKKARKRRSGRILRSPADQKHHLVGEPFFARIAFWTAQFLEKKTCFPEEILGSQEKSFEMIAKNDSQGSILW